MAREQKVDLSLDRDLARSLTARSVQIRTEMARLDHETDSVEWQALFAQLFDVDEDINRLRRAWS